MYELSFSGLVALLHLPCEGLPQCLEANWRVQNQQFFENQFLIWKLKASPLPASAAAWYICQQISATNTESVSCLPQNGTLAQAPAIAKCLSLNFCHAISSGRNDMDVFWEEFILRKLHLKANTNCRGKAQRLFGVNKSAEGREAQCGDRRSVA
jgi:hypothetical protein